MSKQETLGFILIGLVLIVWMWLQTPPPRPTSPPGADSIAVHESVPPDEGSREQPDRALGRRVEQTYSDSLGRFFSPLAAGEDKVLVIETDLYSVALSSKGGLIKRWELKSYRAWDGHPVQMVDPERGGDLSMLFLTADGKEVSTRSLYFHPDYEPRTRMKLEGNQSFTVTYTLPISDRQSIVKKLTFVNGTYNCLAEWELMNLASVISNFEYQITWETGIRYAEYNSIDESSFAAAYVYAGGELAEINADEFDSPAKRDVNGATSWVAVRNKYFAVAMIPAEGICQGAYIEGRRTHLPDAGAKEDYSLSLKIPFKGRARELVAVNLFVGPLDFDVVKAQGKDLDEIIGLGAAWIIRPISEFVMIPLFNIIHFFIPNYGLVIIVFSIIIKIVLTPLSKSSLKSMRKMQALQPMMEEIRTKYKDDPAKVNQQVMNLYKEYGVNPAAGCLPLLLQMPILFALYSVFRSAIELRQASFVWWMNDLSVPDVAFTLPFAIPLIGISEVSGLALAMGITMFIQQKMTVKDPRQKMMVWSMPLLMTILFNGLPAGLNLYYFVFNLLSIGQQVWMNKHQPLEPLRKVDHKKQSGGLIGRLTKDLPSMKR
jgi:YidC/Oxa1 family membrane protein insertase